MIANEVSCLPLIGEKPPGMRRRPKANPAPTSFLARARLGLAPKIRSSRGPTSNRNWDFCVLTSRTQRFLEVSQPRQLNITFDPQGVPRTGFLDCRLRTCAHPDKLCSQKCSGPPLTGTAMKYNCLSILICPFDNRCDPASFLETGNVHVGNGQVVRGNPCFGDNPGIGLPFFGQCDKVLGFNPNKCCQIGGQVVKYPGTWGTTKKTRDQPGKSLGPLIGRGKILDFGYYVQGVLLDFMLSCRVCAP